MHASTRVVERHPTIKMLALAFLILIGAMLVAEGFHQHISKGYIYLAMTFAVAVEMLNLRMRARQAAKLRGPPPALSLTAPVRASMSLVLLAQAASRALLVRPNRLSVIPGC